MAGYAIRVRASVEKDIAELPRPLTMRILQSIEDLSGTPLPSGARKLSGTEYLYRLRVGDYRIIYAVHHAEQEVIILYIRHRRSAYRGL
ncbi:MAG: type II toxin-antitoxin system RelE/ParE family toxin [Methanoculleus sp.]